MKPSTSPPSPKARAPRPPTSNPSSPTSPPPSNSLLNPNRHLPMYLQRLLVQDYVGDQGLQVAATICKDLRELRVYPITDDGLVTEKGFVAISEGCPELRKILYFCKQMSNAAMTRFAKNCPKMTHFRLCIIRVYEEDCDTREPLDKGFGAVCKLCKELRRLSLSGLLTDRCFEYQQSLLSAFFFL